MENKLVFLRTLLSFVILWAFHIVVFNLLYDVLWNIQELSSVGVSWGMLVIVHKVIFGVSSFVLSIFEIFKKEYTKIFLITFCAVFTLLFMKDLIVDISRRCCTLYFCEMVGLLLPYVICGIFKSIRIKYKLFF